MRGRAVRRGQMSLEYVVKMIILVVVLAVVIGLVQKFSGDAKKNYETITGQDDDETTDVRAEIIEADFDEYDMANYIEMCWAETRKADNDMVCFIIDGAFVESISGGNPGDNILELLDDSLQDRVNLDNADFTDNMFTVKYELIGSRIVVQS